MNDVVPNRGTTANLKTVVKALWVLKAFRQQPEWGVSELARELGMARSIAHRLASTLASEGFLVRLASGTYALGPELISLTRASAGRTAIGAVARPHMERLARRTDAVVTLAVLRGHRCVFLDIVDLGAHVRSVVQLGDTLLLGVGAGGRAILAFQESEFVDVVLDEPLARYTDRSPTDRETIMRELEVVRRQGWAYSAGEVTPGTATVAAPVRSAEGRVVASLNITTTSSRLSGVEKNDLGRLVAETAREVSADLGFVRANTAEQAAGPR